jgi:hypothetical protein
VTSVPLVESHTIDNIRTMFVTFLSEIDKDKGQVVCVTTDNAPNCEGTGRQLEKSEHIEAWQGCLCHGSHLVTKNGLHQEVCYCTFLGAERCLHCSES